MFFPVKSPKRVFYVKSPQRVFFPVKSPKRVFYVKSPRLIRHVYCVQALKWPYAKHGKLISHRNHPHHLTDYTIRLCHSPIMASQNPNTLPPSRRSRAFSTKDITQTNGPVSDYRSVLALNATRLAGAPERNKDRALSRPGDVLDNS